ncbi:hypothetical protein ACWE42_24550 [Sutcliffiella cohnii]
MNKPCLLILITSFLIIFITGCNKNTLTLITSEEVLPNNFEELTLKGEEQTFPIYLLIKAGNQTEFENTWKNIFGLKQIPSEVDFDKKLVYFLGFYESGSCPTSLGDTFIENSTLTVNLKAPSGNCTDDLSPKTLVFETDIEKSKDIKEALIIENGHSTKVQIETIN